MTISVIVPIYNVEKYMDRCIESLVHQTYKDLEIILVDDGSPDSCPQKCDEWALKDNRIKVVHKQNGGLSSARNAALNIVSGKYTTFVDSDDYIHEDYVEYLFNLIKKYSADMSICEFDYINEEGKRLNHPLNNGKEMLLNQKEALRYLLKQKPYSNSASGKLFKTEDFSDIRFPKDRIYEDTATIYKLFLKAEKMVFGAKPLYYYIARNGSISRSTFSVKQMDNLYYAENMVSNIVAQYPDLYTEGLCRLVDPSAFLLRRISKAEYPQEWQVAMDNMLRIRKHVLLSREASLKRRVIVALSFLGETQFIKFLQKI